MPPSSEDYSKWSVSDLKTRLQELGITSSGTRQSLVDRLTALAPAKSLTKGKAAKCKVSDAKTKTCAKSSAKTKVIPTCVKSKVKATLVKAKPAASTAKCRGNKKDTAFKGAYDVGDLSSSVASLNHCLRDVPIVDVMQAVAGPGPCLLKAIPKSPAAKLRSMVTAHEFECKTAKLGGISWQHRLVIRLYTAETPFRLYRVLNSPFHAQKRTASSIANQGPFMKLLLTAVRTLAKKGSGFSYTGPAYRGVRVADSPDLKRKFENYAEAFQVGSRLTFAAFTSLSISDTTAESFGDQILFQFTRVRGVRISDISAVPSEMEILVEPPAVFEVKSCAKFHGVLSVVLEAVGSPLKYL
eukprot:TRINITY_DN103084_c0_g1_i1.p1 TRINITY_DN103084_c0_g1~~TRINITY_DN103084_c0_g1_i1.p1  ORF type:complete len:355 (-),score=60.64 TRINITY_DN103084_c0_g1_i1:422-1486(-)